LLFVANNFDPIVDFNLLLSCGPNPRVLKRTAISKRPASQATASVWVKDGIVDKLVDLVGSVHLPSKKQKTGSHAARVSVKEAAGEAAIEE
jgi:hypothetical protein